MVKQSRTVRIKQISNDLNQLTYYYEESKTPEAKQALSFLGELLIGARAKLQIKKEK